MIDFHCHLDLYENPADIIRECVRRGVYVLSVTTTPSAWHGTMELSRGIKGIRTALGFHPQVAAQRIGELKLFDSLVDETRYIGEIGLDGSPEFKDGWDQQVTVFEHILSACEKNGGKIISVHSRKAVPEVLDMIEKHHHAGTVVLHWYSGSHADLERAIEMGCWFSINPAMILGKKGTSLISKMPIDRILTETDGPFSTVNGRMAMPWDIEEVVTRLAALWKVSKPTVRSQIKKNLFKILKES